MDELDRLLRGISTYQDVVVAGKTVRRGVRDCETRWRAIAPHLPTSGVLLDVGASFCWFCLRWCREGADRIALGLEADYRTAAVARHALASHDERRIALCTAAAGAATGRRLTKLGRRIDAAICLSVLHWIPEHREFLTELGSTADRIFVEQPNVNETGAGSAAVRNEIGEIGPYLKGLFRHRTVEHLASWRSHRPTDAPRELWLVGPAQAAVDCVGPAAIDAATVCELECAWPPRSWWRSELIKHGNVATTGLGFSSEGVIRGDEFRPQSLEHWREVVDRLPEHGVTTLRRRAGRLRRAAGKRLFGWMSAL